MHLPFNATVLNHAAVKARTSPANISLKSAQGFEGQKAMGLRHIERATGEACLKRLCSVHGSSQH